MLGGAAALALLVLGALQFQAELPSPQLWLLAALLLAVTGGGLWRLRPAGSIWMLPAAAAWGAAVLAWGIALAQSRLADSLPPAWEGRPLWLDARVSALPQQLEGQGGQALLRLTVQPRGPAVDAAGDIEDTAAARLNLPATLSLWFEPDGQASTPRAGEHWRLLVRLRRVHALQNPGLPDGELWLLERAIGAQGSVVPHAGNRRLTIAPWWSLQAAREGLRDRLAAWVRDTRARSVLSGLLLGDQAALSGGCLQTASTLDSSMRRAKAQSKFDIASYFDAAVTKGKFANQVLL